MKFKIEIEITLTEEDVDKIMKVALEEGIGYWCQRAEVAGGEYLGEYASDVSHIITTVHFRFREDTR